MTQEHDNTDDDAQDDLEARIRALEARVEAQSRKIDHLVEQIDSEEER